MMECLSEITLAKELWGTALEAIGTTEIDLACDNFLRGMDSHRNPTNDSAGPYFSDGFNFGTGQFKKAC
jgi:hypothetical protein